MVSSIELHYAGVNMKMSNRASKYFVILTPACAETLASLCPVLSVLSASCG